MNREVVPAIHGYAGLLAVMFAQPTGDADGHYLAGGLGRSGFGASGVVGGFLDPHLSIEAEASLSPSLTTEQWSTYMYHYAAVYRDQLFSGFIRWHRRSFQRNLVEPVLGLTIAATRASRSTAAYIDTGAAARLPFDDSVTQISVGVGGGADLVVPIRRGIAAVASFRLHLLKRNDERDGPSESGMGRLVYHVGVGLQWSY